MKRAPGFTFVELIIASIIVTLALLSAYSAFHAGILSYRKIDSRAENYQQAEIAFSRIEADLKNAFIFKPDDSGFKGSLSSMQFWSIVNSYQGDQKQTDLCHIGYEAQDAGLKRTSARGLSSMTAESGQGNTQGTFEVTGVEFHYAVSSDNPQQPFTWADSWPREGDEKTVKSLPLAVRVKFLIGAEPEEFTRTIALSGFVNVASDENE